MDPQTNGEIWLLDTVGPQVGVAIDVGANVGDWTLAALERCPNLRLLVCYEPSLPAAQTLRQRLPRGTAVQCVEAGVSDALGDADFYEPACATPRASFARAWGESDARMRRVPLVTIDDEIERLGLAQIDFLKIDVEGYDLHVLRGARRALSRQMIALVQFEYNEPWMYAGSTLQAAHDLLAECGYELFLLRPSGLSYCDVRRLGELFQYMNFIAAPQLAVDRLGIAIESDRLWG